MNWNYSVEINTDGNEESFGVKIYKSLISESGEILTTVETTVEDAKLNAEAGFILEYYQTITESLTNKLSALLEYSEEVDYRSLPSNGAGLSFGMLLNSALVQAKELRTP